MDRSGMPLRWRSPSSTGKWWNPTETERLRAALDVAISALAGAPLERDTRDLEDAVDRAQKALSERMDEQAAKP